MTDTPPRLELKRDAAAVGDQIEGKVIADAAHTRNAAVPLSVELLWRTTGECRTEETLVAQEQVRLQGDRPASFSLRVPPAGPMTYAGKAFSIHWFVRLTADGAVEAPLTVLAARRRAPRL